MHRIAVVDAPGISTRPGVIHSNLNSGAQAINLASLWGAAKIVLLGYDMMRGPNNESHHHGDHEGGLPNLGTLPLWVARMEGIAAGLREIGVQVINASKRTAIESFPRAMLGAALRPKPALRLVGMSGLGDNLHQRAVVRKLMEKHDIWLETPWPSVYHDLPVTLVPRSTVLRTQAKNAQRERSQYSRIAPPWTAPSQRIWYTHDQIRSTGSFLRAMALNAGLQVSADDFVLPIPASWDEQLDALLRTLRPHKPLMLYRPLVERREWVGCAARNPQPEAYVALARSIRERFYVISVADLEEGTEWAVSAPIGADAEFHWGQLPFEVLAALAARSALVFASPGFALVLAQAVRANLVAVFGGHEAARFYDHGRSNELFIQPNRPCECFSKNHPCDKTIDLPRAVTQLKEFLDDPRATAHPPFVWPSQRLSSRRPAALPAPVLQPG